MKFNRRLGRDEELGEGVLSNQDVVDVMKCLINIRNGKDNVDDIDHLGNRRVRSVGEMAENAFRLGLIRVERAVRERLSLAESEGLLPQDLINAKPAGLALIRSCGRSPSDSANDRRSRTARSTLINPNRNAFSAISPTDLTRRFPK